MQQLFHGGVHPEVDSLLTVEAPAFELPAPELLYIPLIQHKGAAAEPLVKVGDQVRLGQRIGDAEAAVTAAIHAPVSGEVRAIDAWHHPDGDTCPAIILENDGRDTPDEALLAPPRDLDALTGEEIIKAARDAGIVGMGGAGFPLSVKLSGSVGQIETVILNGCECEPMLHSDHSVMRHHADKVVQGGLLLRRAVQAKELIIAVEDNKPDAIAALEQAAAGLPQVSVRALPTRYPQGGEKILVKALLKREVPMGKLPAAVGALICNVDSAATLAEACRSRRPLISRNVTVAGSLLGKPQVLHARIGTPFSALIAHCEPKSPPRKLLSGGPMMGRAQYSMEVPVTKTVSGILLMTEEEARAVAPTTSCIRCGRCVKNCPMLLSPCYLNFYSDLGNLPELERLNIDNCIECGICTYSCPAHLPLLQKFRLVKLELGKQRRAAKQRKEGGKQS